MRNVELMPADAGWQSLRYPIAELEAINGAPFTRSFLEEHGDVIERVLRLLKAELRGDA